MPTSQNSEPRKIGIAGALWSNRSRLFVGGVLLLVAVGAVRSWPFIPRHIRILSGPAGSTTHTDALAYAEYLSRHGVVADVVETSGAFENLEILATKPDDRTIGFSETGIESLLEGFDGEGLVSLGSVRATPFWLFVRRDRHAKGPDDLRNLVGRLIVPAEPGSALRAFLRLVLEENGIPLDSVVSARSTTRPEDTLGALESGEADATFIFGAPGSPIVDGLLESDLLRPLSIDRAEAYDRRYDRIAVLTLPEGAFDLGRNIPSQDLTLLAAPVQIVAPEGLSEMLVDLVLDAASEVHREATLLTPRGRFPAADLVSRPLSPAADRFFTRGPSPLRRWMPYWAATLLDRFWLSAAAILTTLRLLPFLFALPFQIRRRQIYGRLEAVESALGVTPDRAGLLEDLASIRGDASAIAVPRRHLPDYFEMCQAIEDVRTRAERTVEQP
jgi:TRAP-type uncharacterized transport system substrate-binding protein